MNKLLMFISVIVLLYDIFYLKSLTYWEVKAMSNIKALIYIILFIASIGGIIYAL